MFGEECLGYCLMGIVLGMSGRNFLWEMFWGKFFGWECPGKGVGC